MQKLSKKKLLARDAKRDLNAELLKSINDLKVGKVGRVSTVTLTEPMVESPVAKARTLRK